MRQPVVLAKQLATIDALSDGRLTVGIGVGPPLKPREPETTKLGDHRVNAAREYRATGLAGERGRRTDEYIDAMVTIWTQERASFSGEFVSFEDIEVFPKPVQAPHPPIVIGGRSTNALRRVARLGTGWCPSQVSAAQLARGVARLRSLCTEQGRTLTEVGVNLPTVLAATDEKAEGIAGPTVRRMFPDEREYRDRTIAGSVRTFRRRVREYEDAGASYLELKPLYPSIDHLIWQMRTIREHIMPRVGAD